MKAKVQEKKQPAATNTKEVQSEKDRYDWLVGDAVNDMYDLFD
jgi:hypothetical protein